jgi:predicted nucleotidyltransferase
MITASRIRSLSRRIAEEFRPERIILFGSHATGRARPGSDVDLLVIMPFQGKGARKSAEILNRVEPDFPVDVIVRTPSQVRKRIAMNDFFLRDVVAHGKVLYEAAHP